MPRDEARNKNLENNPDYGKAEDLKACVDYFKCKNILRESFLTVAGKNWSLIDRSKAVDLHSEKTVLREHSL